MSFFFPKGSGVEVSRGKEDSTGKKRCGVRLTPKGILLLLTSKG